MTRSVESMYREWRRQARAGLRRLQESSAPLYERTRLFRIYEHTALPGLFHTAEYSMEIMNYWMRFLGLPDDAEAATAARLARQKVLRSARRRFVVVLAEQTLRTRVGTPQVMAAQLQHLLEVMRLPNVSVGIIPAMAERYTVAQVPFWIWDDARVTIETISASLEITRPDEIALYATVFDQLRQSVVYGSRATELISAVSHRAGVRGLASMGVQWRTLLGDAEDQPADNIAWAQEFRERFDAAEQALAGTWRQVSRNA
jgi:Domain of unknown function (DUF5753)